MSNRINEYLRDSTPAKAPVSRASSSLSSTTTTTTTTAMIKKRTRPQASIRAFSRDADDEVNTNPSTPDVSTPDAEPASDEDLAVADLIELRKLRRQRQGIDITKLGKGDAKRKRKKKAEGAEGEGEEGEYGLRPGAKKDAEDDSESEQEDRAAKARRAVRANNFTQQTNVLDVDKHMMAYIEENMKLRRGSSDPKAPGGDSKETQDEMARLAEKYKLEKKAAEEGSVTNSMAMLTAIPEVDLGMDARLKNIEETEKAKLLLTQGRKGKRPEGNNDEERLAASRFYRPNLRMKSDADIIRDAKLEAMGLPPEDHEPRPRHDRPQMATDEAVMERFKKRMRK
ncbi:hypothetical protein EVG20_g8972 [Dentipellis fragilis]|uniref:Hepatocellular carcinoma-associated antigen 59 domain-containing protein n=1 Tax=Dentipellis fragilis TaxID=205917 RepID=A0A4Y9Y316_9AGAM|nr:hypothetical protein EVG20_g8972 [Dentipellis fragilis]